MVKKGIRVRICHSILKYAKPNNKQMKENQNKETNVCVGSNIQSYFYQRV